MYHLSLYFDNNTNSLLQKYQELLHQPLQPLVHLTLYRFDSLQMDQIIADLNQLLMDCSFIELYFVSIGSLQGKHLMIQPVYQRSLHQLMNHIETILVQDPHIYLSHYYRYLNWLPHVTLARNLDQLKMKESFSTLNEELKPFKGKGVQIRLTHLQPYQEIKVWYLK